MSESRSLRTVDPSKVRSRDMQDAGSMNRTKGASANGSPLQIIVLGMHRSGTSALTGALAAMGVHVGDEDEVTPKNWENPKGFFERRDARQLCDALLHRSGADWWKVSSFNADNINFDALHELRPRIADLVRRLDERGHWALKEPRLCHLLPAFQSALRNPLAIMTCRHPLEVARSLRRRNGFSLQAGLALWEAYTVAMLHHGLKLNHIWLDFDELAREPAAVLSDLAGMLERRGVEGLDIEAGIVSIDPNLRRETFDPLTDRAALSPAQAALWKSLMARSFKKVPTLSAASISTLREFESDYSRQEAARRSINSLNSEVKRLQDSEKKQELLISNLRSEKARLEQDNRNLEAALDKISKEAVECKVEIENQNNILSQSLEGLSVQFAHERTLLEKQLAERDRELVERDRDIDALQRQLSKLEASTAQTIADKQSSHDGLIAALEARHAKTLDVSMHNISELNRKLTAVKGEVAVQKGRTAELAWQLHGARGQMKIERARYEKSRRVLGWRFLAHLTQATHAASNLLHAFPSAAGRRLLRSPLFDAAWYTERYNDVSLGGVAPLRHYLMHGASEGRDPHPLFDTSYYLSQLNGEHPANPLFHYLASDPALTPSPHPLFDPAAYLAANPDVAESGANPLEHYVAFGGLEGRQPHARFDSHWYLSTYPDVAEAKINPLVHYLAAGAYEGRDPSPAFGTFEYIRGNPRLISEELNPLVHHVLRHASSARPKSDGRSMAMPRPQLQAEAESQYRTVPHKGLSSAANRRLPDLFDLRAAGRSSEAAIVFCWSDSISSKEKLRSLANLQLSFDLFLFAPEAQHEIISDTMENSIARRKNVLHLLDYKDSERLFCHLTVNRIFAGYNSVCLIKADCKSDLSELIQRAFKLGALDADAGVLSDRIAEFSSLEGAPAVFDRFRSLRDRIGRPYEGLHGNLAVGEFTWMRGLLLRDLAACLKRAADIDVKGLEGPSVLRSGNLVQAVVCAAAIDGGFMVEKING